MARSAVYAQGDSKDWYNEKESYRHHDLEEQTFRLVLRPHGNPLRKMQLYHMAEKAHGAYEYLADSAHAGKENKLLYSLVSVDSDAIYIAAVKKAEDDGDTIIRLLETEGRDTDFTLCFDGKQYDLRIGCYAIATYKINPEKGLTREVNLLEWDIEELEGGCVS